MPSILERQLERFRADPTDRRAFEALEEAHFVDGEWDGLVRLYTQRLTAPDLERNPRECARLWFRLGQVWDERCEEPERAAECYRAAVEADPSCRPALAALRQASVARGQWDVALQIAEAETDLEMATGERASLLAAVGAIWLEQLDDPEQAHLHFDRALEQDPEQPVALEGAARATHRLGRPREAASLWARRAAACRGPERARALVHQAGLLTGALDDPAGAAELYRRALTEDPQSLDALEALAAVAESERQWTLLAELHERRYQAAPDSERRAAVALAAGRLHHHRLGDLDTAAVWLARASEQHTRDPFVPRALAELARQRGDDAMLRHALVRELELADGSPGVGALVELASLHSEAGDEEPARKLLERAVERAPQDALVIEALSDSLARLGRYAALADCLERRAELAAGDTATRAGVLAELAAVQLRDLDDAEAARHSYARAFEADPTSPGVARELERIYRKGEAWQELRVLLEITGHKGRREERVSALCSLGELLAEQLDDRDAATRAFEATLALDREWAAAHRGLQRLASDRGDETALLASYEREAAVTAERGRLGFLVRELARMLVARQRPDEALAWARRWIEQAPEDTDALQLGARLLEDLGRDSELIATLERLDPELSGGERAACRRRRGAAHRRADQRDEAIAAYRAALDSDPEDVESLESLVSLLEGTGRAAELADVLGRLVERVEGERRAAALDPLARLLDERLGDVAGAIDALQALTGLDETNDEAALRLEELLERAARHDELVDQLARRAQRAAGRDARELDLRRAAILLQEQSRFAEAVSVYREILSREPGCDEARAGLERGLRAAGEPGPLADFLGEQSESHPDAARRHAYALEHAVILEEVLDRSDDAISIYRSLATEAHNPGDRARAAQRLTALLERRRDWLALREHWESCLEAGAPREALPLHERTARLCRERLDDADGARIHLEAAASLAPLRADLWRQLAELHDAAGRFEALVETLEAELGTSPDRERELELRTRAAALCVHPLADEPRALAHYERIAVLDPGDSTASEALIRRAEEQGCHAEVARLLDERLTATDALPRDAGDAWAAGRTALRLRIAGLRAGPLDDPDGAIASLEPALGEIGPRAAVAEPLADLYERTGYTDDLIELCRRAAEAADPGPERAGWLSRHGDALRRRGRDREAAETYRAALDERPDDSETKAALREVYRRLGEAGPLVHLLESELGGLSGPDEIPVRAELARLLAGPISQPAEALVQLRRIVELDPGHAEALQQGLTLADEHGRPDVVRELLDTALSRPLSASARAQLLVRRGRLGDSDPAGVFEAAADYREALSLEPRLDAAREALRQLLETTGQWEAALDCRFQQAQSAPADTRPSLLERGAEIAWEQLSPDAALPWLERLRRAQPGHAAVVARIAEVHRIAGRPRARLRALEDQLSLTPDPAARRDLQLERARLLERELDAPARAARAIEEAHSQCPEDLEVLRQLDRLYRDLERPRERTDVLETLARVSPDRDKVGILCEAAELHRGPLADPRRAAGLLLRAVAEAPPQGALRAELLRSLGEAFRVARAPDAWCRCAEAELAALDPEAEVFAERRLELRRDLALSYGASGRLDAALRHLRPLVDDASEMGGPDEGAETALLDALRIRSSWIELERRLAARLTRRNGTAEEWLELARLRAEQLAAPAAASVAYRGALEDDPGHLTALRGLRAVAERLGDWEEVAATLEGELEHTRSRTPEETAALLRRLGDVCWRRLGSTTRASRAYAAAIEAHPQDFAAHRALERLLEAMEDWRGALDLYESEIEVLGEREPARRQAAWLRAGEIARDQLGEIERALRAYVAAAALAELPLERRAERAELHRRCGELEAFAAVFASWCDDPEAPAQSGDHVRLARTLEELGDLDDALTRAERSLELDPGEGAAWDLVARVKEGRGDAPGAAYAWERAASCANDGAVASRLMSAARLSTDDDPAGAAELLRRAAAADPAAREVQSALARVAYELEAFEESERAAARVLELEQAAPSSLDASARLATALCGARAARALGRTEAACRFYGVALDDAPDDLEALAGAGETRAALGDLTTARQALERLLGLEGAAPERALHHALLARCLASEGQTDAALEQCEAALAADPAQEDAFDLAASLHEQADRLEAGIGVLERWAQCGPSSARAQRLLRAAEWELRAGGHEAAAEQHLRDALEADPELLPAWERLATRVWDDGRSDDALELASAGLEYAAADHMVRAALGRVRARALEQGGEREAAARAYAEVAEADPRCIEAATAWARLLRAGGDWSGAADALELFARRHPGGDPTGVAAVLQQLGRLLAGPLEDLEQAVEVYRRAVELDPDNAELRVMLAELLTHTPQHWMEALAEHGAALEREPLRIGSLRAVLRLAEERAGEGKAAMGLALLRALGEASPLELEQAPPALPLPIARNAAIADPVGEGVRRAVAQLAREIGEALGAPSATPPIGDADGRSAGFRTAALSAEAELAAPGLLPLSAEELRELLLCITQLASEAEPEEVSGATLNALSQALGRRARRRARRALGEVTPAQAEALDVAAWRSELRCLAAAAAVDATGGDLRTALVTLVCERLDRSAREISESTKLTPLVEACPEARDLLSRAVRAWLADLRP